MPHDTPAQAIARGILARLNQQVPSVPGDFNDHQIALSGVEIGIVRAVLTDFVRVPAEPSPGDPT
jgi:hypothetical protein